LSNQTFTLEYLVKVTGGSQAASQINGVTKATQMNNAETIKAAKSQTQLGNESNKTAQKMTGTTRSLRGLTFGLTGLVSSGVEAIGMWGIYTDAQKRVDEATRELAEATKKYGEDSKQVKDATNELAQAERALNMVRRNTILSMFDMVTWITLTVNGILKLRQGQQAAAIAQQQLAATTTIAAAAQQRQVISTNLLSVGTFTLTPRLLSTAAATGAITPAAIAATGAVSGLTKAMRLLKIASVIGIPLVILEIASQAFQNNWGGFADKVNAVGKAFGDWFPILKPILEILGKIGRTIAAIFTGNFEEIGKIWSGTSEGMSEATKMSEELSKAIDDLNKASAEYVLNLAEMDKKQRKSALFDLGIKGGAAKRFKGVLDDIDKIQQKITGFSNAMQTIRQVDIWEKLGLKDVPNISKKIFFTFEDRFDEISEMFKKGSIGKQIFNGLEETMRKAAKDPSHGPEIIANYLANNPTTLDYLKRLGFTQEAEFLQTMVDEALQKVLSSTSAEVEGIGDAALGLVPGQTGEKDFTQKLIDTLNKNMESLKNAFENAGIQAAGAFQDAWLTMVGWKEQFIGWIDTTFPGVLPTLVEWGKLFGGALMLGIQTLSDWGSTLYTWIDEQTGGQLTNFTETGKKIGESIWKGITEFKPSVDASSLGLILGGQAAFGEGVEVEIPIKPKFTLGPGNGAFSAEVETDSSAQLSNLTQAYFSNIKPVSVPVKGQIVDVDDVIGAGGGAFGQTPGFKEGVQLKIAKVPVEGVVMSIDAASMMNAFALAKTAIVQGAQQMVQLVNQQFAHLAQVWSVVMNSLGANAKSGESQVINTMNTMAATMISLFNTIAKNWSKVMNSIISNAKSAASGVSSASNSMVSSLKKVESQAKKTAAAIRAIPSSPGKAEGGVEAAATGKFFTVNGERQFKIGDNPGGRESVAFIPHNNPQPTLDKIAQMFGTVRMGMKHNMGSVSVSRGGGGDGCVVQVFIGGRQIKPELVQILAGNQMAMK
jgi:hypothetical protein